MKILKKSFQNQKEIIKAIEEGKVVIYPTDTIYGLLADAASEKAVEKIFRIKKRPKNKALPVFVKDIRMAKKLAFIDKEKEIFLKKVWPGKITVILKARKSNLVKAVFGRGASIGLRIPDYDLINELLEKINKPLAETSVNISGKPASVKVKEILNQFKDRKNQPDLALNVGDLPENTPSTVIDFVGKRPKILRKGRIEI